MSDSFNTSGQWTAGFTYDVLGNVLTATDANGTAITNEYDKAGRVKTRSYSGEVGQTTPAVSFFYDGRGLASQQSPNFAKGKLTKVTSSVSETRYKLFDNFGRLTESKQITDGQTYTSGYQYNFSGALIQETYPSGRVVKNEFEADGDLLRVFGKPNANATERTYANSFSYTASGGISQMKLGNGRWETAKFNTQLQVTELGLGSSSVNASLWKTAYEYGELDSNGNLDATKNTGNIARQTLTIPSTSFVQSYRYDPLYRLTEAFEKTGTNQNWIQNWTYDIYGNRSSFTQNIAGNTNAANPTVDVNTNRFTTGQGFVYDLNGNLVTDAEGRQFTFNGDNKQTVVRDASNNIIGQYFYDGEGKRIKKVTDTETTVFVYSSGKLVAEYSTQLSQNPTISYTTTDHLGSPRIITDQFGQVKSRRDFMPFGEELSVNVGARTESLKYGTNPDNIRQKFTGYQKDTETSLDFAEARMYENRFGRFTAVDPLLASGKDSNPQTFNRYIYVMNNPTLLSDPSGMMPDWIKERCGDNCLRPRWVDREATAEERWENMTFITTDTNDLIQLFAGGPLDVPGVGYMAGYAKNGITQGTGIYGIAETSREITVGYYSAQLKAVPNAVIDIANFGLWGMSPVPSAAPQIPRFEYSSTTEKVVGYPTEFVLGLIGGGGSASKIPSVATALKEGGMSFSAYRAARGSSEVLGRVPVMTRSGNVINYAIRTELSHMFISQATQRAHNLPNWLVNNRFNVWKLNTIQHALIDPQRFKFLPVGLKPQVGFSPGSRYNFFTQRFQ